MVPKPSEWKKEKRKSKVQNIELSGQDTNCSLLQCNIAAAGVSRHQNQRTPCSCHYEYSSLKIIYVMTQEGITGINNIVATIWATRNHFPKDFYGIRQSVQFDECYTISSLFIWHPFFLVKDSYLKIGVEYNPSQLKLTKSLWESVWICVHVCQHVFSNLHSWTSWESWTYLVHKAKQHKNKETSQPNSWAAKHSLSKVTQGQNCREASRVLVTSMSRVRALTAARRCCASVNDNLTLSQG